MSPWCLEQPCVALQLGILHQLLRAAARGSVLDGECCCVSCTLFACYICISHMAVAADRRYFGTRHWEGQRCMLGYAYEFCALSRTKQRIRLLVPCSSGQGTVSASGPSRWSLLPCTAGTSRLSLSYLP
ncbi:hypothetical protein COO60DRAFT_1476287, partial [Scenedesmus sp. NREL 46B-D3]